MFELQLPWILALAPLPFLIMLLPSQQKPEVALQVPFFNQVKNIQVGEQSLRHKYRAGSICLWLIWLSILVAAAKPQWLGDLTTMPNSGRDLMIAVDISGSMGTPDMVDQGKQINRLIAVKKVIGDFAENRKSDRLGLILFGSQAYLQAPLTYDRQTVHALLQETEIGFAGDATAIGDAIGLAIKRLRTRPDAQRVLIILTDGANTAGELQPIKAAELAAQEHVKIYTVGFGADEMVVDDGFFGSRKVNPSQDLDESTMRAVAEKTGGEYFRARNLEELSEIHRQLNQLEPIELEQESFRPVKNLFYWPLSFALLLSIAWALLLYTRTGKTSSIKSYGAAP